MILALHGWLDNSESFAPLAQILVPMGYQLLALDWPGHGHSGHRGQGTDYHFLDNLYELDQVMAQLPQSPYCLLGHSMGGILASLYAGVYPERVQRLISIEAVGPLTSVAEETVERMRAGFASRRPRPRSRPLLLSSLIQARLQGSGLTPPLVEQLLRRNLHIEAPTEPVRWRSDPRLRRRSAWMMTEPQAHAIWSQVAAPALFLLGEQGFPKLRDAWQQRQGWIPHALKQLVPGAHHCHMTDPEPVAQAVHRFLGHER
ncbi:alpha/beta hydrolase [Ferrimonas pelagia]|uniref:Alpha/beta hydrolase n=2 Tax=Ferrimonas pelagia TaxID=1177826 RepID=A0ABP9FDC6_9GAMM